MIGRVREINSCLNINTQFRIIKQFSQDFSALKNESPFFFQ